MKQTNTATRSAKNGTASGNQSKSAFLTRRQDKTNINSQDNKNSNRSGDNEYETRNQKNSRNAEGGPAQQKGASLLEKFFLDLLKDIYYAEQKIVQSLPKMIDATTTDELKDAFEDHLHQTQRHVKRLEQVFQTLGKKAEGKKCEAIEGITREVESIINETEEGTMTRDAALIIAAQKVEHYEIATYGGLVQLAITMRLHDAADLLDKTLIEEEDTDSLLTEIAENNINLGAESEGNNYSWQQDGNQEDVEEKSNKINR